MLQKCSILTFKSLYTYIINKAQYTYTKTGAQQMNWNTIDQRCETTPFKLIDFGNRYRIELYHTLRAGTYGHQVYAVWVDYKHAPVFNDDGALLYHETKAHFYKTDGCGYCKPSAALQHVFTQIGYKPKGFDLGATDDLHQYRKGGNYYNVPQSQLRKVK